MSGAMSESRSHAGTIKAAAKSLGVDFRAAMILAAAGTGSHPELVLSLWCHVEVV